MLEPALDTFSIQGTALGPADLVFVLDELSRTLGLTAQTPQSLPGHVPHGDFGAFLLFLGKVIRAVPRSLGQSSLLVLIL